MTAEEKTKAERDFATFYYAMRPGEALWEAVINASTQAGNNGFHKYEIIDSKGKPIPRLG